MNLPRQRTERHIAATFTANPSLLPSQQTKCVLEAFRAFNNLMATSKTQWNMSRYKVAYVKFLRHKAKGKSAFMPRPIDYGLDMNDVAIKLCLPTIHEQAEREVAGK